MQSEILRPATAPESSLDVKNLRLNSKPESKSAFEQNQQVIPMYSTVWGVPLSESPSLPLPVRSPTNVHLQGLASNPLTSATNFSFL